LLKVRTENVTALQSVVQAAQAECANSGSVH
jgi:hypothetical protein